MVYTVKFTTVMIYIYNIHDSSVLKNSAFKFVLVVVQSSLQLLILSIFNYGQQKMHILYFQQSLQKYFISCYLWKINSWLPPYTACALLVN